MVDKAAKNVNEVFITTILPFESIIYELQIVPSYAFEAPKKFSASKQ
jgi:hypothetical protein